MSWLGVLAAASAHAGGGLQRCLDQAADHNGEPPTCTKVDGTWVATWPDDAMSSGGGSGFVGAVALIFVLGLIGSIVVIVWRVRTAQTLARRSGLDESIATQMALFTDNGLDATYLAASLRQPPAAPAAPATPVSSPAPPQVAPEARAVAERLAELTRLRDQGVITPEEHDRRRAAIIDQV
jgi:hypothetical protein